MLANPKELTIEDPPIYHVKHQTGVLNGVKLTFSLPNKMLAHEFRNVLALAMNTVEGNERLFNYENGVTKNGISPFRFGNGYITAIDQHSAAWLVSRSFEITGVLSKHFQQFVDFKVSTVTTSAKTSNRFHGYVCKGLTFAKTPQSFKAFMAKTNDEKKVILAEKIKASLVAQAAEFSIDFPESITVLVSEFGSHVPVLLKPDQNGRPLWASALQTVNFVTNVELLGSWSAGYLNSRGNGNILSAAVPAMSVDANSLLALLSAETEQ